MILRIFKFEICRRTPEIPPAEKERRDFFRYPVTIWQEFRVQRTEVGSQRSEVGGQPATLTADKKSEDRVQVLGVRK